MTDHGGTTAPTAGVEVVIDTHVHFWERNLVSHPWLTADLGVLYADYVPADLESLLASTPIRGVVVVQSANSDEEDRYLQRLAIDNDWILGVVGWLGLEDPVRCARDAERAVHLVGIRHLSHTEADPDWLVRDQVIESLHHVADAGLVFEVPAEYPRHIAHVATIADEVPTLRIVIDHLGKPPLGTDQMMEWERLIRDVAARPNVHAKVSGLNTMAPTPWSADDLRPAIDVALDSFGPERLLFGSDWPVCLANGDHAGVVQNTIRCLNALNPDERRHVLHDNAMRLYGIEPVPATSGATGEHR